MEIKINVADSEVGNISDGYHTFNDLYNHRHALFCALMNAYPERAFKTKLNKNHEVCYEGYFIAGLDTSYGQITYHLPNKYWHDVLKNIKEFYSNNNFDGHSAEDVVYRLLRVSLDGI